MNITAAFRILLAGILAAVATIAVAQSSTNFKSPAFTINAGVGDMASANFQARASVGQPFSAVGVSSAGFTMNPGLFGIPTTTSTIGNLPVFNTGVATDHSMLPGGSVDPHYTLITSAEPSLPGPNAIVTSQIADGYWIAQGPNSKWIAPSANQSYPSASPCNAGGTYVYRTLVDLTGYDPTSAVIQGKWAADNQGTAIRLNGVSIGATQPGYNPFHTFTISSGFIAGVNTLDFDVFDYGCPNGLRVELSGTATTSTVGGTPTFSPGATTLTFASQAVSTTSGAQTLTIANTGTSSLTIATPIITGPFAISANNCASVAPAGSCAISVTFTPVAAGAATGTLTIPSNATGSPHAIALAGIGTTASSGPFAYITNQSSNNVSVIDTASDTVVATIPVGSQPYGVAVNPAGTRVYVTNQLSNNVSVINTATNTVVATVNVGTYPNGVVVSPDGTRAYVANSSNSISVIDTASDAVLSTIAAGTTPVGIAINPAGTRLYVANNNSNNVSVINTTNNSLVINVGVGSGPMGVAINPAGTRIYVANSGGGFSIIDTSNNFALAHLGIGGSPVGLAVSPDGTRLYMADASGTNGSVNVIDPINYALVTSITVGRLPVGIALNADGTRAYVANRNDNNVSVIDIASNTVLHTVPVGSQPNAFGLFIGTSLPAATVPGAPTISSAIAGNSQATINFMAPANNGGNAITSYAASCSAVGQTTRAASGAVSPITVTSLTNFVGYTCTVSATNATGTSAPSAGVVVVPVAAPGITSGATADGTIAAAFSYQILTNAVASSYGTSGTLPGGVTLNASTGLISGTPTQAGTFNVTVSATNAGGTGSLPIVITITSGVVQYTVTPDAGAGGSISPSTPQLVTSGATTAFTVTPDAGNSASVAGTCGGALVGSTYATNTITANCTVLATFSPLPVLQGVVSRKFHGTNGDYFDVIIDHNIAIGGHVSTEPRMVGSGFTLIFTFDRAITTAGPVTAVDRFGDQVGVASAVASGNTIVVTLIGVPNNQRVQVSLTGVNGNGLAIASMGFLVGDVGNNRSVSSRDISAIKARRNRPLNVNNNFRADVNLSGAIDQADVTMTKARAGLKLP